MKSTEIKFTRNIKLKSISIEDIDFILNLRTNPKLNRFISSTTNDYLEQLKWIKEYEKRYIKDEEFYFKIVNYTKNFDQNIGLIRIYNIDKTNKEFTWGSWIIIPNDNVSSALESALTIYHFAFDVLRLKISKFDVRKQNLNVINIHKKLGSKELYNDNDNIYFSFDKLNFKKIIRKYKKFLINEK